MTTIVERGQNTEATALAVSGACLAAAGGTWWAFDADPALGRFVVVAGLVVIGVGLGLRGRLGTTGRRLVLLVAVAVFLVSAVELWQAIVTIDEQRRPTLA